MAGLYMKGTITGRPFTVSGTELALRGQFPCLPQKSKHQIWKWEEVILRGDELELSPCHFYPTVPGAELRCWTALAWASP